MSRLNTIYVELSTNIKMAYIKDDFLIAFDDFECSSGFIDRLYKWVREFEVERLIIVFSGVYSNKPYLDGYQVCRIPVGGVPHYCCVSMLDINKIAHVAKVSGISDVHFVDGVGYYLLTKVDKITCFISTVGNTYSLAIVQDSIREICYTRASQLEDALTRVNKNYGVVDFVDVSVMSDFKLVSSYRNIAGVLDEKVLATLSLFRYADLEVGNTFELDPKSVNYTTDSISTEVETVLDVTVNEMLFGEHSNMVEDTSNSPDLTNKMKGQGDLPEVPTQNVNIAAETKDGKHRIGSRKARDKDFSLNIVLSIVMLLIVVSFGGSFAINHYVSGDSVVIQNNADSIQKSIESSTALKDRLGKFLEEGEKKSYAEYVSSFVTLLDGASVDNILFKADCIEVTYLAASEKIADLLEAKLKETFSVTLVTNSGVVSSNGMELQKYCYSISY